MDESTEVLLVEDNANDVRFMQRAWQKNQIPNPLRIVRDGAACLEYLKSDAARNLGLILMDIDMPRMTGIECLAHIREDAAFEHLPVIILSGSQQHQTITQSYKLGCNSFIEKPQGYGALQDTVRLIYHYWNHNKLPGNL